MTDRTKYLPNFVDKLGYEFNKDLMIKSLRKGDQNHRHNHEASDGNSYEEAAETS